MNILSKIHVLSEHLTNMIAAGEVVERPAGIVKECVENSIDAQANVIEVEVFQGGIERIVITDDGIGMDNEDAHLAFMRHATSKMHSEEELFNIQTMGFRGEALPSIASVAQVELQTNDGNGGTLLRYNYGSLDVDETCSCPRGTKLDVSGLFVKTPARFKHLKSISYEFSVIADLMNKMALSHPYIRFILSHDGRVVFQTSGNGNIQEILYQMYGREVAENAVAFDGKNEDFHISGYAIQPKINRATKYFMFLTLNTRLIRSVPIQKAIIDAYSDYMPPNRFPIVVLQMESDTQLVDVNVHPNKWEVRLSKQGQMLDLVKTTIRDALNESLRTVEVKKVPIEKKSVTFEQPEFNYSYSTPVVKKESFNIEESFKNYNKVEDKPILKVEEKPISYPVFKKEEETYDYGHGPEFFRHLQVLAQLHDSYILCSNEEGLVIVDQHAAQERYHYEQLKENLLVECKKKQPLMVPIQLDVSSDILAQYKTINDAAAYFGFEFEPFGTDQLVLREIPLWFHDVDQKKFLQDLIDYFAENNTVDMAMLRKHMIATMACHSSIRFNRPLSMQEMKQVISDLQKCKQPYHCPHGRPTVIVMRDSELRKEFERG